MYLPLPTREEQLNDSEIACCYCHPYHSILPSAHRYEKRDGLHRFVLFHHAAADNELFKLAQQRGQLSIAHEKRNKAWCPAVASTNALVKVAHGSRVFHIMWHWLSGVLHEQKRAILLPQRSAVSSSSC